MEETQTLLDEDATLVVNGEEATLVAPRFDDEETLVARPVVPLEEGAQEIVHDAAHDVRPAATVPATPAPNYRRPYGPRRTWMLALMLASVLVGGVLGGAGLYLYQRQTQDSGASARPETSAEAAGATNAPVVETQSAPQQPDAAPTVQTETLAASEPRPEEPAAPDGNASAPAREPESIHATERRAAPREDKSNATPRHGKQGDRDEEIEHRPARRAEGNVARAESGDDVSPQARRVDTIFYRQRRAARRARRDDDTDRLRRIFEGTPER